MRPRLADIVRRCRRAGPRSLAVVVAVLSSYQVEPEQRVSFASLFPVPDVPAVQARKLAVPAAPLPSLTVRVTAGGAPVADADVALGDGSQPIRTTARTDASGVVK